jgi:hypothetical protein
LFWGLQKVDLRKSLALGMVFGALVVVPMYILLHDRVVVGSDVQPRYIYPLLIMLAGVALFGLGQDNLRMSWLQLTVISVCLFVANGVALHVNIRRYVTGIDVGGLNLDSSTEWWWGIPITPMGVWAVGAAAFGLVLGGLVVYSFQRDVASTLAVSPASSPVALTLTRQRRVRMSGIKAPSSLSSTEPQGAPAER